VGIAGAVRDDINHLAGGHPHDDVPRLRVGVCVETNSVAVSVQIIAWISACR
jgi:hypothetical protein